MARQPNLKDMAASIYIYIQIKNMQNKLIFETIPNVMKFLSSEESDYMYSKSQMDVAVFASMLNINIHIFQYNRVKGVRRLDTGKYKISYF